MVIIMHLYMEQDAISSYFSRYGHKATLNNMMYNYYTRRITCYKIFLGKLFPKDEEAIKARNKLLLISTKKNVSMKAYRRRVKANCITKFARLAKISTTSRSRVEDDMHIYDDPIIDDVINASDVRIDYLLSPKIYDL